MDKTCINNNILNIQCKHGVLGSTLNAHLSGGTRKIACLNRYNVATGYLLNILRGYTPFQNTVTYAYKFTFTREAGDTTSATVTMTMKNIVVGQAPITAYTGTGSGADIAAHFESVINAASLGITYYTERVGNVLYVYSYDSNVSFSDVSTLGSSTTKVTATTKSLENNLDEILNIWNSLTEQELCNLITFATKTASTGEDLPTGSSGGCNC